VRLKNTETLEGKIDLNKIRDIRRAIRRRYANRSNF
jgi:Ca2+-binding EF-hand superfamily protein